MAFFLIMYFEIEPDVIDYALSEEVKKKEVAIDLLRQVAYAIQKGKHVIVIDILSVNKLLAAQELFSRAELAAFYMARKKYIHIRKLEKILDVKFHITFQKNKVSDDNIIYIDPEEIQQMEYFRETFLLTENLEDAEFFRKYVVNYYQRKVKIHECCICSHNLMGGGTTTADVMRYEKDLRQNLVFAIADSDRKYKGDVHKGDTARNIERQLKNNPFNCGFYMMEKVCEVENLLPLKWLEQIVEEKNHWFLSRKKDIEMSYFDMKNGLTEKFLNENKNAYEYWTEQFNGIINLATVKNVPGFGEHIFSTTLKKMKDKSTVVKENDLTDDQQAEWFAIGKRIFNWCCCYSKMVS